jgi:hypothetical protein
LRKSSEAFIRVLGGDRWRELRALRAAFATAQRWKLITENPCSEVKQIPFPDEPPVFFSVADFEKLAVVIEEG